MSREDPGEKAIVLQVLRGVDNSITSIASTVSTSIRNNGLVSTLLLLRDTQAPDLTPAFDELIALGLPPSYWGGLRVRLLRRLYRVIVDSAAEIVVVHRYKEFIQLLIISRFLRGIKIVAIFHGERDFRSAFRRGLCSLLIDDNCYFVAVSDSVNRYLVKSLPSVENDRVITISNGVDFDKIEGALLDKTLAREQLAIPAGNRVFGTVGRLAKTKGPNILLRAFAEVVKNNRDVLLVLIGEGSERASIEQLIVELNLQDKVMLPGNIPEAYKYLAAFDYFVFPSVREGFGLAVVEAFAARVPVILSDLDVFKDLAGDQRYMVPAGDTLALGAKMNAILGEDISRLEAICESQYAHCADKFTVERTLSSYQVFFSQLSS